MDYCSSCRRHLNGALVCPGCGAYAPDIAPMTAGGRVVPAPVATATTREIVPDTEVAAPWRHGRLRGEIAVGAVPEEATESDSSMELVGAAALVEGRAARRRQRARWKKNQRRAVVATAVALVGGGLAMSAMDRQSGDRALAATAPQDPGTDAAENHAEQEPLPTSIRADTDRSAAASSTPRAGSPAPDRPRHTYATAYVRNTPSTSLPAATAPRPPADVPAAQPKSTAPTHEAPAPATPAPARPSTEDTPGAHTQTPATTDGTSATSPAPKTRTDTTPASSSPSEICLLVVCLPVS
ncbi:hypothetical protein ACIRSU_05375 [Streptomyces sp. NPDC101160]|uniref:SCO2400 family protein n=1 Tax=Streptomyces sp. NPDC101160 TaxID=3366118 RepID=UPI0038301F38